MPKMSGFRAYSFFVQQLFYDADVGPPVAVVPRSYCYIVCFVKCCHGAHSYYSLFDLVKYLDVDVLYSKFPLLGESPMRILITWGTILLPNYIQHILSCQELHIVGSLPRANIF